MTNPTPLKLKDKVKWKDGGAVGTVRGFAVNGDPYIMCETPPFEGWSIQLAQRSDVRKIPKRKEVD